MAKVTPIRWGRWEGEANSSVSPKHQEMLVVMTALIFVEQHALLTRSQLNDAKRSIQAFFIRTSGEETMLRKLINVLAVNRDLRHAFSAIAKISTRIATSVEIISKKIRYLNQYVARLNLTPEENTRFFEPFLSFTHQFLKKILSFSKQMESYLGVKEIEAKRTHEFRIAHEASERLKKRLSGKLGADVQGEVETTIKREVLDTFDYAEAQENLLDAQRSSRIVGDEIVETLVDLKEMCQVAMNPDMREKTEKASLNKLDRDDIFALFTVALRKFPRLGNLKEFLLDYFKLYQRAYGMFTLDYNNFDKAVETIANNPDQYFFAKHEDEDIKVKQEKLSKIEGMIPFLETTASIITENDTITFQRFSKKISDTISASPSQWEHISEDLLVAKVSAEAELSTRI